MEYLTDKLGTQYLSEIQKVILFSKKVALNFDCLRAIAFELSMGGSFETVIQDLNIINTRETAYNVTLHFIDGTVMKANNCRLDMFNKEGRETVYLDDGKGRNLITAEFMPSACTYDPVRGATILPADSIVLNYNDYYGEEVQEETQKLIPEYLSIVRAVERNIHYLTA